MPINGAIIETLVPEEVYTDRKDHIEYFYKASIKAITRRTMSTVLLGQRRMGKTEIFKRVVNRLFFDQQNKEKTVIPVYYQFPEEFLSRKDFAVEYVENFLRWFAAFKLHRTALIEEPVNINDFLTFFENNINMTQGTRIGIDLIKAILADAVVVPEQKAVHLPKTVAFFDDITIAIFLDEFQNTRMPHLDFSIVGFFQEAVESPKCPHFITGSAMSILANEILGKGALYGRFRAKRIESLTDYYGEELTHRAANYYHANISTEMAAVISDRCGGNPFYINAVIQQAAEQNECIDNEQALNKMLAIDISSGFIWMELSDQVNRWIERINEYGITKWILYLAAIEEGDEIDLQRIQQELKKQESKDVSISKIKEIMIKLARGDLLEYKMFGNWFCKINDPILNEFLKVWGEIEVARYHRNEIEEKTIRYFEKQQKRFHEYKGYLAEVYMIQFLWNAQKSIIPKNYFHSSTDIKIPDRFIYIDQCHRQHMGKKIEVDIYASSGTEIWIAESKWHQKPIGIDTVQHMLKQAKVTLDREGDEINQLTLWLFSYAGVTAEAENLMKQHGILWSSKDELNALLELVGLRQLPNVT
ncbi:ATPase domain protein, prokaryote domain protein [Candidatus Magnetomorum sp. HK-1]|nr:ATPase domain protein, prokaryote domain protein [Candidatus Magnetomorum sp. HK-1]